MSLVADDRVARIKANLRYLHARLLGEELEIDDPAIERSYALFKEVFENEVPDADGLQSYCEARNGNSPARRAWNAALAYLMTDFRYLND